MRCKKSCAGCPAFEIGNYCQLGYPVEDARRKDGTGYTRWQPVDNCDKPKNLKDYIEKHDAIMSERAKHRLVRLDGG